MDKTGGKISLCTSSSVNKIKKQNAITDRYLFDVIELIIIKWNRVVPVSDFINLLAILIVYCTSYVDNIH